MTEINPETKEAELTSEAVSPEKSKPRDSYVKLAMRNMVRKGSQSLRHFFLTVLGLSAVLIGLSYLTKP